MTLGKVATGVEFCRIAEVIFGAGGHFDTALP